MNEQQQQQQQPQHLRNKQPNKAPNASSHSKPVSPTTSSTGALSTFSTNDLNQLPSTVTNNVLPSPKILQAAALHNSNETATAMSAHVVTNSDQISQEASASAVAPPTESYTACGKACWVILGPVIAGVVVAAMIFGLVMIRRRSRMRSNSEPDLKKRYEKGKQSSALDDDDLMVEMFEPPELLSSGNISGAFFNWRNASAPNSSNGQQQQQENGGGSRRGSAQLSGRSTMLGLTTILEEGSRASEQQRIKKYHGNIRRPSNKAGANTTPLRIAAPNPLLRGQFALSGMRNMSPVNTPPLSPLISPTASPAPSDSTGGGLNAIPGQPLYLTTPVGGGRQKRKLTIPYNPGDVTRRRSLEGAW